MCVSISIELWNARAEYRNYWHWAQCDLCFLDREIIVDVESENFCATLRASSRRWQYESITFWRNASSYVPLAPPTVKCLWQSPQRNLSPPVGSCPFFCTRSLWQCRQSMRRFRCFFINDDNNNTKRKSFYFFFKVTVNLFLSPSCTNNASLRRKATVTKTIIHPSTTNSVVSLPPVSWCSSNPIRRGMICNKTICAISINVEIEKNFPTDCPVLSVSFDHLWIRRRFASARITIPSRWIPCSTPSYQRRSCRVRWLTVAMIISSTARINTL